MRLALFVFAAFATATIAHQVDIAPRLAAGQESRLELTHVNENSSSPQSNPTANEPAPLSMDRFRPVPLADLGNQPLDWLTTPPQGLRTFGGVPFAFGSGPRAVFATRTHFKPDLPTEGRLSVSLNNVTTVHALISGGWVVNVRTGEEVGQVRLLFDNGRQVAYPLVSGRNIREGWEPDRNATDPAERVLSATRWKSVWSEPQRRGQDPAHGFLDMISFDVPAEFSGLTLSSIVFLDSGIIRPNQLGGGSIDPNLQVVAVTIEISTPVPATQGQSPMLGVPSPGAATEPRRSLDGTWVLISVSGRQADAGSLGNRLKVYTDSGWGMTQPGPGGLVQFHHGGTYTLAGDDYTENVEYANQSTSNFIGRVFRMKVTVAGDTMTQNNNGIVEAWRRVPPGVRPSEVARQAGVAVPAVVPAQQASRSVPPRVLQSVQPVYPVDAMRDKLEGAVRIEAMVLPSGTVGSVRVIQSIRRDLDEEALRVARLWRFAPGTIDDKPVPFVVQIEISFRLSGGSAGLAGR